MQWVLYDIDGCRFGAFRSEDAVRDAARQAVAEGVRARDLLVLRYTDSGQRHGPPVAGTELLSPALNPADPHTLHLGVIGGTLQLVSGGTQAFESVAHEPMRGVPAGPPAPVLNRC